MPTIQEIAASLASPTEERLFSEYGSVFATTATPPPTIVFADGDEVKRFQSSLNRSRAVFGTHEIELQVEALDALSSAASEIASEGGSLTARAEDAGGRSFEDTVRLWTRNVTRGLEHWEDLGRITEDRARAIRRLSPSEQISVILKLEDTEHLFFGTFFDKSILYSVAAPGASQHLAMLAFDVAEYQDPRVEQVAAFHGWYRTVPNDIPHFTYLGREQNSLPSVGLKRIEIAYGERVYCYWIPDLDSLRLI